MLSFFKKMVSAKMLVSTGCGAVDCLETGVVTEVIDLLDPSNICEHLDNFPIETSQGTGDLLEDKETSFTSKRA